MDARLTEYARLANADRDLELVVQLQHEAALPDIAREVARFGDIVTCRVPGSALNALCRHSSIARIEPPRGLGRAQTQIHEDAVSLMSEDGAHEQMASSKPAPASSPLLCFVDFGLDFAHPNFLNADGSSRIQAFFNQHSARNDSDYGYGTVHTKAAINAALSTDDPYTALDYHPSSASRGRAGVHGCYVMDIAAGAGRVPGTQPGPGAHLDLAFVHLSTRNVSARNDLGDSVRLLESLDFLRGLAASRPWVVNLSLGTMGGSHLGDSLVELAMEYLLKEAPGRAIVQSTGNYRQSRTHAAGRIAPGSSKSLSWVVHSDDATRNEVEIWYGCHDRFAITLRSPEGANLRVEAGQQADLSVQGHVQARVFHQVATRPALENHINIFLEASAPSGRWEIKLEGLEVADGRFHAWIERDSRGGNQSQFAPQDAVASHTLNSIANGYLPIAVGAYDAQTGEPAPFSSEGPTRDGRQKPDVAAPGLSVAAARSTAHGAPPGSGGVSRVSGTSMASPLVAASVALIFEASPRPLTIYETRATLFSTLQLPQSAAEERRFGFGKLDLPALQRRLNTNRSNGGFTMDTLEQLEASEADLQFSDSAAVDNWQPRDRDAARPPHLYVTAESEASAPTLYGEEAGSLALPTEQSNVPTDEELFVQDLEDGLRRAQQYVSYVSSAIDYAQKWNLPLPDEVADAAKNLGKIAKHLTRGLNKFDRVLGGAKMVLGAQHMIGSIAQLARATQALDLADPKTLKPWLKALKASAKSAKPFLNAMELVARRAAGKGARVVGRIAFVLPVVTSYFEVGFAALKAGEHVTAKYFKRLDDYLIKAGIEFDSPLRQKPSAPPPTFPGAWYTAHERIQYQAQAAERRRRQRIIDQYELDRRKLHASYAASFLDRYIKNRKRLLQQVLRDMRSGKRRWRLIRPNMRGYAVVPGWGARRWWNCFMPQDTDSVWDNRAGFYVIARKQRVTRKAADQEVQCLSNVKPPCPYFDRLYQGGLDQRLKATGLHKPPKF